MGEFLLYTFAHENPVVPTSCPLVSADDIAQEFSSWNLLAKMNSVKRDWLLSRCSRPVLFWAKSEFLYQNHEQLFTNKKLTANFSEAYVVLVIQGNWKSCNRNNKVANGYNCGRNWEIPSLRSAGPYCPWDRFAGVNTPQGEGRGGVGEFYGILSGLCDPELEILTLTLSLLVTSLLSNHLPSAAIFIKSRPFYSVLSRKHGI